MLLLSLVGDYMINNKLWDDITKRTKKCKCGHSITFKKETNRVICNWCGHWCYQNKFDEFKYRLRIERDKLNDKKR